MIYMPHGVGRWLQVIHRWAFILIASRWFQHTRKKKETTHQNCHLIDTTAWGKNELNWTLGQWVCG